MPRSDRAWITFWAAMDVLKQQYDHSTFLELVFTGPRRLMESWSKSNSQWFLWVYGPICGCFLGPWSHNWGGYTEHVAEPSHGFMICGERTIIVDKANWTFLKLPLFSTKIINQKWYCIPRRKSDISATLKDLKPAEVIVPNSSPFNSTIWSLQQPDGSCRWWGDINLTKW